MSCYVNDISTRALAPGARHRERRGAREELRQAVAVARLTHYFAWHRVSRRRRQA